MILELSSADSLDRWIGRRSTLLRQQGHEWKKSRGLAEEGCDFC